MEKAKPSKKKVNNGHMIAALKVIHDTEMKDLRTQMYIACGMTALVFFLIGLMF